MAFRPDGELAMLGACGASSVGDPSIGTRMGGGEACCAGVAGCAVFLGFRGVKGGTCASGYDKDLPWVTRGRFAGLAWMDGDLEVFWAEFGCDVDRRPPLLTSKDEDFSTWE